MLVVASVATVAPNGLAFTAVAEISGPYWSGRALGVQNTSQYVFASAVPPVFGALAAVSFPVAFLVSAVFPALSVPIVPDDPRPESPDEKADSPERIPTAPADPARWGCPETRNATVAGRPTVAFVSGLPWHSCRFG